MVMLHPANGKVKTPGHVAGGSLSIIAEQANDEGYQIAGTAALQRSRLVRIGVLDHAGDMMRRELSRVIKAQRRYLLGRGDSEGAEYAAAALEILGVVDELDDAEDGDPLQQATVHNTEMGDSARRIIAVTEPVLARRNGHMGGEAA